MLLPVSLGLLLPLLLPLLLVRPQRLLPRPLHLQLGGPHRVELGEQLGFDSAYLRHRHFQTGISSPIAIMAAASQRTRRIAMGTAGTPLGWENPLRMAEDLATVDILSGGRLEPGFSIGPPIHWDDVKGALYPDTADAEDLFVVGAAQREAKQFCRTCPVRTECLAHALDAGIEFGVWGGMTERERRALLRRRPDVGSWMDLLTDAREQHYARPAPTARPATPSA